MSEFANKLAPISPHEIGEMLDQATQAQVQGLLDRDRYQPNDAFVLLSEAAKPFLETLAKRSRQITQTRFGRTITLYSPIYLSSHCINGCRYCGFSTTAKAVRKHLSTAEAYQQARYLIDQGIRNLLLVTGEAPNRYGLDQLCEVAECLRGETASLSVEIFPCDLQGYQRLVESGVDGLVLYQETYAQKAYQQVHPSGPKSDYQHRLGAIETGGQAGFRSLGIGSLLGLAPWRIEACYVAWHAAWLSKVFPYAKVAISFPRLRPIRQGFAIPYPVSDRDLVQFIVVMRLLFPDAELVLSTRESAQLRDRLIQIGITRISAGSCTTPGGYGMDERDHDAGQFRTHDRRSILEVTQAIRKAGFDPVFKDFDPAFME